MEQSALLRAAAQRLTTTPTEDLPRVASFIALSLANCSAVLNGEAIKSNESSVSLHKLRTKLSSLLQDRTSAGRSTAAIVIKSFAEASRPTESAIWESWARGLIGCLNKPDPWEVKRLYLAATVRIFLLVRGSQTLQREVTTPLLPPFIAACISSIKPVTARQSKKSTVVISPLLSTVLRCWDELIQDHSATFRPFVSRIKPICLSLVSDFSSAAELRHIAAKLLASLLCCTPKASAAGDWQLCISNYCKAAHDTLDLILRAVHEDWKSSDEAQTRQSIRHEYSKEPEITQSDAAGLDAWKGIHQGIIRVCSLIDCIIEMLRCKSLAVAVPLGLLLNLTVRINGVTLPNRSNGDPIQLHLNSEVTKEEKEALWADLPTLHVESMKLLSELVGIHGQAISTLILPISEQLFDIFLTEGWNKELRRQGYICLSSILRTNCCHTLQFDSQGIEAICKSCCHDLGTLLPASSERSAGGDLARNAQNGFSILQPVSQANKPISVSTQAEIELVNHARKLLPLLLGKLSSSSISHATRIELDRTSILVNDERAIFASVMNPPEQKMGQRILPSILPFFARAAHDDDMDLEALMRPRMPVTPETFALATEDATEATYDHDRTIGGDATDLIMQDQAGTIIEQQSESMIDAGGAMLKSPLLKGPQHRGPSPLRQRILGKRDLKAMAEAPANESGLDNENQHVKSNFKKPRSEDQHSIKPEERILEKQGNATNGIDGAASGPEKGKTADSVAEIPPQFAVEQPMIYGKDSSATAQDDSDSDSDIPAINPELATDDEFEDEDDEE